MKASKTVWLGRVLSILIAVPFVYSGIVKLVPTLYPGMAEQMGRMGLPLTVLTPIGILELSCTLVYLIPPTAILGAILMTGYLGGAILTHVRVGEPVYLHIVFGVIIWLGIFLREPRLREILPFRKNI